MDGLGWIVIGAIVLLVVGAVVVYNRLVALRNRTEEAWAQIDVQLKRRYDLIPNLVEKVRGYAAHERETLEGVIKARQQAVDTRGVQDQAQAENLLTQTLRQLFAVAEAYPDLKANENFMTLQRELSGTESQIAHAREAYNSAVLSYDTARETFPSNLIAGAFTFETKPYFEAEEASRANVPVDFGSSTRPSSPSQSPGRETGPA